MGENDARVDNELVGSDRDGAQIVAALLAGTSVVVVGTLGSGKSHVIRDVIARLRRGGVDPLVLRSGGPMAGVPLAALDAVNDPRAERLRAGEQLVDESHPIVIVDDAHDLDEASAAAIVRAVYGRYATALFALSVSRDGSPQGRRDISGAAQMTIDLWLRGLVERIDLSELDHPEAEELLARFGGGRLDSLTRASVIGLADGSRMLLRELAREATTASHQGRDPIAAIREAPRHGRLADAMAAHVAQLSADERTALAMIGRVPRVAYADAVRIVPADVLDLLLESGLVYDDSTADRLLTANASLARQAERACEADDVEVSLARVARDMLREDAHWWSPPLARRIAVKWLRGEPRIPDPSEVSESVRRRVALDAARLANDAAESDLAASFARLGLSAGDDVALRIEAAYADAGRGVTVDASALSAAVAEADMDCDTVLRWVQVGSLVAADDVALAQEAAAKAAGTAGADSALTAELELIAATLAVLAMDWQPAIELTSELTHRPGVSASVRMRAAVIAGLSQASLGDSDEARKWFTRARRIAGERDGTTPTSTQERIWALATEVIAHGRAGTDARDILARLDREYYAAAMENDPATSALIGLMAAASAASVGDVDRAVVELSAAKRRARHPLYSTWLAYVEMLVARTLALLGRTAEARSVLDAADTTVMDGIALLEHARLTAEGSVLAAEGRDRDAVQLVRQASTVSESSPTLLARDLFQLLALGEQQDKILPRMRLMAETTSVPVTRVLDERARELVSARDSDEGVGSYEAVKMGAVWGIGDGRRDWVRRISTPHHGIGDVRHGIVANEAVRDLTRREREIALLVAEGLSNREVAARLYLSVRTVESHIYQARAKVDARSRGDLGRLVAGDIPTPAAS